MAYEVTLSLLVRSEERKIQEQEKQQEWVVPIASGSLGFLDKR